MLSNDQSISTKFCHLLRKKRHLAIVFHEYKLVQYWLPQPSIISGPKTMPLPPLRKICASSTTAPLARSHYFSTPTNCKKANTMTRLCLEMGRFCCSWPCLDLSPKHGIPRKPQPLGDRQPWCNCDSCEVKDTSNWCVRNMLISVNIGDWRIIVGFGRNIVQKGH